MNDSVEYERWIRVVSNLEERKRRIEARIDREAEDQLNTRKTLPGTTASHLANGMKTKDDRITDLDQKIDRAVARATMHGMGMIYDVLRAQR
jgi:chaperonin cofactor prefoldin